MTLDQLYDEILLSMESMLASFEKRVPAPYQIPCNGDGWNPA